MSYVVVRVYYHYVSYRTLRALGGLAAHGERASLDAAWEPYMLRYEHAYGSTYQNGMIIVSISSVINSTLVISIICTNALM